MSKFLACALLCAFGVWGLVLLTGDAPDSVVNSAGAVMQSIAASQQEIP